MPRPVTHIRFHPDLHARLATEATERHLDKSAVVTIALTEYFERREAEKRKAAR